jgi:hypothetical protein
LSEALSETLSSQINQIAGLDLQKNLMRQHSVAALTKKLDKVSDKGSPKGVCKLSKLEAGDVIPGFNVQGSRLRLKRLRLWSASL